MLRPHPLGAGRGRDNTGIVLDSAVWPLIGRAREVTAIAAATNAFSGCAGVAITGGLGVGKSRLAREAVAASERAVVHWTAGSAAARAIPLGAFVKWLPPDVIPPEQANPGQAAGRVITSSI